MSISVCPPERLTESRISESADAQISVAAAIEISCGVGGSGKLRLSGGHMRGLCCWWQQQSLVGAGLESEEAFSCL